jgi:hypothetical protein
MAARVMRILSLVKLGSSEIVVTVFADDTVFPDEREISEMLDALEGHLEWEL